MTGHPLAFLRGTLGLSHPAYAQLIAQTHSDLGYGQMAARREKVSRWESGRIVPHLTTQLAIARIHGASPDDVLRLGWPAWLHSVSREAVLTLRPWSFEGMLGVLEALSQSVCDEGRRELTFTGFTLAAMVKSAMAALPGAEVPARAGSHLGPGVAAAVEARVAALESMRTWAWPTVLCPAVVGELQFLASLLAGAEYDGRIGTRLLVLVVRVCDLAAALRRKLGDYSGSERYLHLAVRAAVAGRAVSPAADCFEVLARLHDCAGDPEDALLLRTAGLALRNLS
ncbi:hypothetical protein [Kitasatospora sp. NPDC089509]|uniref:hypothetical protein n=1 Tax=Kitasatospora sp. NPDC089509 TaxID=3364079 RepID=UPI0037F94295